MGDLPLLHYRIADSDSFLTSLHGCIRDLEVRKDCTIEALSCMLSLNRFSFLHQSHLDLDILPHELNLTLHRVYHLGDTSDKTIYFIVRVSHEIYGHFSLNGCFFLELDRILDQVFFVVVCRMQMLFATSDLAKMF